MILLSIGDEVREGTYRLHSRFHRAVNFADGERLVSVVAEDIGPGPLNLVVRGRPRISRRVLRVTRRMLAAAPISRTPRPRARVSLDCLAEVERVLVSGAHPRSLAFLLDDRRRASFTSAFDRAFVRRVSAGAARLFRVDGVRMLAGCGYGLTPSGDDFIAGVLAALNLRNAPRRRVERLYAAARGGNLLSNEFLRLARDGKTSGAMQSLVSAVAGESIPAARAAARKVLSVGETSGADWATGFVLAARKAIP